MMEMTFTVDGMRELAGWIEGKVPHVGPAEVVYALRRAADELDKVKEEAAKDYAGMRHFQVQFMKADHALRDLQKASDAVVEAAEIVMDQQTDLSTIGRCGGDDDWYWCEPEATALWVALRSYRREAQK